MKPLIISDVLVRQDAEGRCSLNDLHRAAGGEKWHRPNYWLENQQTKELVEEISKAGIPAIQAKQGYGAYVCKELVYAYAMWISPAFHLKVIRAFYALTTGRAVNTLPTQTQDARTVNLRLQALGFQFKNDRDEWELTKAGKTWVEALPYARNDHAGYQILWRKNVLDRFKKAA